MTAARHLLARALGVEQVSESAPAAVRDLLASTDEQLIAVGLSPEQVDKVRAIIDLVRAADAPLVRGATMHVSADVFRHYRLRLRDLKVEQFHVLMFDGKHRVLGEVLISQGTLTSSPVHPREVFRPAMLAAAAAVVLVHNHPSGDPQPSADDLEITRRLAETGRLVGIQVLDHVIIGDGAFTSLADRGLMS